MSHRALRDPKAPAEAEISDFTQPVLVHQNVLGLQVAVEDASLVQELHALQDLEQQRLGKYV
jgi:hypothetical protein